MKNRGMILCAVLFLTATVVLALRERIWLLDIALYVVFLFAALLICAQVERLKK